MIVLMLIEKRLVADIFSHVVISNWAQQPAVKRHQKAFMGRRVFVNFIIVQPQHLANVPEVKREGRHKGYYI